MQGDPRKGADEEGRPKGVEQLQTNHIQVQTQMEMFCAALEAMTKN